MTALASLESEATALANTGRRTTFWSNVVRMMEYPSGTFRYKMIVTVETPEGIKTGSVVREVHAHVDPTAQSVGFYGRSFYYRRLGVSTQFPGLFLLDIYAFRRGLGGDL